MADVFGDLDLFSEFDKDREAQGGYIYCDEENQSRIVFEDYASDESESEEETDTKEKSSDIEVKTEGEVVTSETEVKTEVSSETEDTGPGPTGDTKLSKEHSSGTADIREQLLYSETTNRQNPSAHHLTYERNKFRRYAKILDSTRYTPDDESPAVQLLFNNNSFARKYRQQIEQFIKGLLWEEFRMPSKETLSEVTVKPGNPSCVDINASLPPEKRTERMRQNHALIGNSQFHKQFLIDFLGWPFNVAEPSRCNVNWQIPLYGQIFNEIFGDTTVKPAKPAKNQKTCWNCGEANHSVNECSQPRNPAKIAASRKEFLGQQQEKSAPKFSGPSRYHMDPELASKFAKFKPGTISDALRQALGLKADQMPQHIYKMRQFGYPPGWLAEATQVQSGVTIFDKHGRVALITGEHLEDGELDDEGADVPTEYDVNKIIEYPGFTMPVPEGIQDEHSLFKMPPIQQHQLKQTLMSQSQSSEKTAKKRKRVKEEKDEREHDVKRRKNGDADEPEDGEVESPAQVEDGAEEETQKAKEEPSPVTPTVQHSSTISVSKDFGTPIITREKISLPDATKFGKDIEDHIPFENLPNATGTFEKMKDLLDLIRKKKKS